MKGFMKYCLRYSRVLTKFGQQAELLGHLHTEAGKKLPKKLDTRATSLLQKIQFRQGRILHRRATFTLKKLKAQMARMEGNLHSVAGGTMHQTRLEDIKDAHKPDRSKSCTLQTIKGSKNEAGGQFPHSSRRYVWRTKCCKGNFCTAEDRELETVGTRAGSMLHKVKRSKNYGMRSTLRLLSSK